MSKPEMKAFIVSEGNIPVEIINQPIEIIDIVLNNLPFMVTVCIVLCAAIVTYRSNRKSVESQNKLAQQNRNDEHENKISEFRHQWIQQVRDTSSELCQILHELQLYTIQRNINEDHRQEEKNKESDKLVSRIDTYGVELYRNLVEKRSEYYRVSSKLKLLFKRGDPSTAAVFKLINDVKNDIHDLDTTHLDENKIEKIVRHLQDILKEEWEVTKKRTWSGSRT